MKSEAKLSIREFVDLSTLNTFGISAKARYFCEIKSYEQLPLLSASEIFQNYPHLILGKGANILFSKDFEGIVIKPIFQGIELLKETENEIYVKAYAGESWPDFVMFCCRKKWNGLENLANIPGSVGAAPVQNIGAYGVEIKDVLHSIEAFNIAENRLEVFNLSDCEFAYRESVFKHKNKGKYIICSVTFLLSKQPQFNIGYDSIADELERCNTQELTAQTIAGAVTRIRKSKLPDPSEIGSAGSFFKNPTTTQQKYLELKTKFPDIAGFQISENEVKLSAALLIEKCGWKGFRLADAGVHKDQALVLVNYGRATGKEILALADRITDSVKSTFNVELTKEVNII